MREFIFIGRDNETRRTLTAVPALTDDQKAAVTRVQIVIGDVCLDTDNAAHPISYSDGVVSAQIGLASGLVPGFYTARLVVFDAANPNGKAWGEFEATVQTWESCS